MSAHLEVTLTMSRKQVESVKRACDLLSRVYMGQFREVAEYNPGMGASVERYHGTQEALEHAKREAMPDYPRNAYQGIHHPELPDEARMLYDVLRVIDHALAWKDNPEGGIFPRFDAPRQISQEPLPRISLEGRDCPIIGAVGDPTQMGRTLAGLPFDAEKVVVLLRGEKG